MNRPKDFLVEVGTEELPPKALHKLSAAFAAGLKSGLDKALLDHDDIESFATPRRLAVIVRSLATKQMSREVNRKGPSVSVAFDKNGNPTKAALAFAKTCGVNIDDVGREKNDAGEWLSVKEISPGQTTIELIPNIIRHTLQALPIPRRMRWGACDEEFVRPVHWLIMLHGRDIIPGTMFGITSDRTTRGHRFHGKGDIKITAPSTYVQALEKKGFVIADFTERRNRIIATVTEAAKNAGGNPVGGDSLFNEVTGLTEWPVVLTGSFDSEFLALPKEVIIATLTTHQRCFPISDTSGKLLPAFITLANLTSKEPDRIRQGNERVIHARLSDANFFWKMDQKVSLQNRGDALKKMVYQRGLGTLHDQTMRLIAIAESLAVQQGIDPKPIKRAALLAKCDLLTDLVGEFPDLQGTMGSYYARISGEAEDVAAAIGEQYLPRFSGDTLPQSPAGQILAVADKLNILAGLFTLGKKPTGTRDPFSLRRAALGVIRILIEQSVDLDITEAIKTATSQQPSSHEDDATINTSLMEFLFDRSKTYFGDTTAGFRPDIFDAVRACQPTSLLDFEQRLKAVSKFTKLKEAATLAAATKRTANILRKANYTRHRAVEPRLLSADAELALYAALQAAQLDIAPLIKQRCYAESLARLAELQTPVDCFFTDVMVMVEEEAVRANRLALLAELRELFRKVADISQLTTMQD